MNTLNNKKTTRIGSADAGLLYVNTFRSLKTPFRSVCIARKIFTPYYVNNASACCSLKNSFNYRL